VTRPHEAGLLVRYESRRSAIALLLIGVVAIASCTRSVETTSTGGPGQDIYGHGSLDIRSSQGRVELAVRIASTQEAQRQGLMGETSLAQNAGMAFTYDRPTMAPFWMKGTTIPLSIAYWDGRNRIVDILDMEPCTSDPCPLYRSDSEFTGAVEVNRGFFERHGVRIGDTVDLNAFGSD
jgi:hypothetical protein